MGAKEHLRPTEDLNHSDRRPLLMVDIDGVISLFGPFVQPPAQPVEGSFHSVEGIPHFLSSTAAAHLLDLSELFDLVWASGWEDRAGDHLPHLLGVPSGLPFLRFERDVGGRAPHTRAHWKLAAIDAYAGARPLAWIDDALDDACREWASARSAPTLLVQTAPERGLTGREAQLLAAWAQALPAG
jgi:hypothetical protein